jgi:hypothetical protein
MFVDGMRKSILKDSCPANIATKPSSIPKIKSGMHLLTPVRGHTNVEHVENHTREQST